MKIVNSEEHRSHAPVGELYGGELVVPFERPERWDIIVARLKEVGLDEFTAPDPIDMATVGKIHDASFLHFLETAWEQWRARTIQRRGLAHGDPGPANAATRARSYRRQARLLLHGDRNRDHGRHMARGMRQRGNCANRSEIDI